MKFYITTSSDDLEQYLEEYSEKLSKYNISLNVETGNFYYKHVITLNSLEELTALGRDLEEEIVIITNHTTANSHNIAGCIEIYDTWRE